MHHVNREHKSCLTEEFPRVDQILKNQSIVIALTQKLNGLRYMKNDK